MALRKKPNHEKKLVLMLHNAVCNGVEATVGCAFGRTSARFLKQRICPGIQRKGRPWRSRSPRAFPEPAKKWIC
jgi:hypothetical protein